MDSNEKPLPERLHSASEIDTIIGKRLRSRRRLLQISQQELAERAGVAAQQVHKYEHGVTAMRPSRMIRFADVLGVPVSYFFAGLEVHTEIADDIIELLADPKLAKLAGIFSDIEDPKQKDVVVALAESLVSRDASPLSTNDNSSEMSA